MRGALCDELGDHMDLDAGAAKDRIAAHDVRITDSETACPAPYRAGKRAFELLELLKLQLHTP